MWPQFQFLLHNLILSDILQNKYIASLNMRWNTNSCGLATFYRYSVSYQGHVLFLHPAPCPWRNFHNLGICLSYLLAVHFIKLLASYVRIRMYVSFGIKYTARDLNYEGRSARIWSTKHQTQSKWGRNWIWVKSKSNQTETEVNSHGNPNIKPSMHQTPSIMHRSGLKWLKSKSSEFEHPPTFKTQDPIQFLLALLISISEQMRPHIPPTNSKHGTLYKAYSTYKHCVCDWT